MIARVAEKEDISAIAVHWKKFVTEEKDAVDDIGDIDSAAEKWSWRLHKMIDAEQAFVVEDNNKIVGFVCYFSKPETEKETKDTESPKSKKLSIPPGVAFVTDIYVCPEARRSKAAISLFQIIEKSAIRNGCTTIWTNTNIRNRRVHIMLKRLGFSVMEGVAFPGKEKDVYFKKELPETHKP